MSVCWTWHLWCGQVVASAAVSTPWHLWWTKHQQSHDFKVQITEKITNLPRPDNPTINWLQNHYILSIYQDINQAQARKILILNPTTTLDEMRATLDPRTPEILTEKPAYRWDECYPGPKDPWDPDREACLGSGLDSRRTTKYTSDQPAQNYFSPHEWEWQKPDRNNQYCETVE